VSTDCGTPAATPTEYTPLSVYNTATWAGSGNGDMIVTNDGGYLPMATSDCPLDPDMAVAQAYKDKIFNGCLDDCLDGNNAGHGKATVFDWTHTGAGWITAQLSSNLHWTGMWAPAAGAYPLAVVFWIKGAVGCEQDKFTVAVHSHLSDTSNTALHVPIGITTTWQRVVMPWAAFNVPADPYPDALTFQPSAAGEVTFFIDQAYLSTSVPPQ
jgi:hypothetical protein